MGQTLSHGVYLPAEGERNCYSGLASNWQILNTAVGAIAEKAPLVHTHTVSQITDFPAYGNTAGTICEGNDSRLSDARTPVAHTHTKSDVTDLFNSANEWSGNQTYSGVLSLSSSSDVAEQFKQKLPKDVSTSNDAMARVNSLVDSVGHYVVVETLGHWSNYVAKNITLKYKNDSTKQGAVELRLYSDGSGIFYPQSPFGCDLGNIYNKWKTLNGINPGALSLPNLTMQTYDPNNGWYNLDTTDWDLTGSPTDISSDVLKDGYLYICLACDSTGYVIICEGVFGYPNCYYSASGLPISGYARALLPVRRDTNVRLYLKGTSIYGARFFPALGNV